jgi:peroxiredoxin
VISKLVSVSDDAVMKAWNLQRDASELQMFAEKASDEPTYAVCSNDIDKIAFSKGNQVCQASLTFGADELTLGETETAM